MQQSAANLTSVKFRGSAMAVQRHTSSISRLAEWLAKHPRFVGDLDIQGLYFDVEQRSIQHKIEHALHTAATAVTAMGAAQFRLRSFKTSLPPTAGLLAGLPAATLTRLKLESVDNSTLSAITGLTNLHDLSFQVPMVSGQDIGPAADAPGDVRALSSLSCLTKLDLRNAPSEYDIGLSVLPTKLQELSLKYSVSGHRNPVVNVLHLTHLQHLSVQAGVMAAGSAVPPSLQSIKLSAYWAADAVEGLSSLSQLTSVDLILGGRYSSREHLAPFKQLTKLQTLSMILRCVNTSRLLAVAGAWQGLPLYTLDLYNHSLTYDNLRKLMQHIGAATTLVELHLHITKLDSDGPDAPKLLVCEHLTSLTNLSSLRLALGTPNDFVEQDAQHLTALATLTELVLYPAGCGPWVDATTLSLLAAYLTRLEELAIHNGTDDPEQECPMVDCSPALPAIGKLTSLRSLAFECIPEAEAQRGLKLLTELTRLELLDGFVPGCYSLQALWNIIEAQRLVVSAETADSAAV